MVHSIHGKIYYSPKEQIAYQIAGYVSDKVSDIYERGKAFSEKTGLPLTDVVVMEITNSRMFKNMKLFSASADSPKNGWEIDNRYILEAIK